MGLALHNIEAFTLKWVKQTAGIVLYTFCYSSVGITVVIDISLCQVMLMNVMPNLILIHEWASDLWVFEQKYEIQLHKSERSMSPKETNKLLIFNLANGWTD